MPIRFIVIAFLLICFAWQSAAQKVQGIVDADEMFKLENYTGAIPIYTRELKKFTENAEIKYKLGICYLKSRVNRKLAIQYLEDCSKESKFVEDVWIYLGKAYHLEGRLDEALACFKKFSTIKPKRSAEVDRYIEQCNNALEFMRNPQPVSFMNLGPEINGPEPDYYPFVDKDESVMVFTSRRKENIGGRKPEVDGYRSSDIYQSVLREGKWQPAENAGRAVNSGLDEICVGLSSSGLDLYLYMDHVDYYGDVYTSKRLDVSSPFLKPKLVDGTVSSGIETAACFSEDGTVIFFVRRDRLKSNTDLFMARKLPDGRWGLPIRLPDNINTNYNEDMPYLGFDNKTLYFVSEGHNSMGGFDIFKTTWDAETNTFSKPVNLGFPINTTDDDRSICVTRDNKFAYVACFRPSGFGDLDIYRVKFLEEEHDAVIFRGKILFSDSMSIGKQQSTDVSITVTDSNTGSEYYFAPNTSSKRYVMALPAGNYRLVAYCKGYTRYKEEFSVNDLGKLNNEFQKDIVLKRPKKKST